MSRPLAVLGSRKSKHHTPHKSQRPRRKVSAERTPADLPCVHRGEQIGTRPCNTCGGNKGKPQAVYACAVHGECTMHQRIKRDHANKPIHACMGCEQRQEPSTVAETAPAAADVLLCLARQTTPGWYDTRGTKVAELLQDNRIDAACAELTPDYDASLTKLLAGGRYRVVINRAMVVSPECTRELASRYPQTKFVTVCHSSQSDLMRYPAWLQQQSAHVANAREIENCYYAHVDERNHIGRLTEQGRCLWLPNAVFLPEPVQPPTAEHDAANTLRVSLICAPREMKNIPNQIVGAALAAQQLRRQGMKLKLLCSLKAGEQRVQPLLETCGIDYQFRPWSGWAKYLQMVQSEVDVGLQVSFTESFNYVALEHLLCGKPVIGSAAIRYLPREWQASPDDPDDIATKLLSLMADRRQHSRRALSIAGDVASGHNRKLVQAMRRLLQAEEPAIAVSPKKNNGAEFVNVGQRRHVLRQTRSDQPRVHVAIPTCNRPEMLSQLITTLNSAPAADRLTIDVFDDGSSRPYPALHEWSNVRWFRREQNGGKEGYWQLWNAMLQTCREVAADRYIVLPDDAEISPDFIAESVRRFDLIQSHDAHVAFLNPLLDAGRIGQTCWTGYHPRARQFRSAWFYQTQWNDCCLISGRAGLAALDWSIDPIAPTRWATKPSRSSGVGEQISRRLHAAGHTLYQVTSSLLQHGDHASRMHPAERVRHPIVIAPPSREEQQLQRFSSERIIAGMASIPQRLDSLRRSVESLLPQVDELHVYLNEYPSVPSWLRQDKVIIHQSQSAAGDLGDAGKFYACGSANGYYISCDDDIVYPPDYVSRMIAKIEDYDRQCCISLHGANVAPPIQSYYRDKHTFHCRGDLPEDVAADLLGTGVLAFHTGTMRFDATDCQKPNADIWFSLAAGRQQVGLIVAAHRADDLEVIPHAETIYSTYRHADEPLTELVNTHRWQRWGQRHVESRLNRNRPNVNQTGGIGIERARSGITFLEKWTHGLSIRGLRKIRL